MSKLNATETWPALPLAAWQDTYATLHMWTQIVGKLSLATTPLRNHFWNVALRVTPHGLITQPMQVDDRMLTIRFDFILHQLHIECSDGREEIIVLQAMSVADFYTALMQTLRRLGVEVPIWTMPVEIPRPIAFEADTVHHTYDPDYAHAFWRALLSMQLVFEQFRARFIGKCSPVHFFWGSFDLAVTRFSGRRAPERPDADSVTREAYSHEVISHGFWPGGGGVAEAAFYAYAAPEPAGLRDASLQPLAAGYNTELREFILPYEAVRTAAAPEQALMAFLESSYEHAARLAQWDRAALERQ